MTKTLIAGTALSGLVLAGGFAGMVSAQSAADATSLTEEQVMEIALLEVEGEVTEVELEEKRGLSFFEVEILTEDGTEMEVMIAADTGEVIEVAADGKDCDDDDDEDDDNDRA